jgi:hypothetical protein
MNGYGIDVEPVQTSGANVFNLAPEADSAVQGVLNSYADASGTVHHPLVSQAMSAYRETHQRGHLALPVAIRALGSNTVSGANAIVDGTNEATSVQQASLGEQEALGGVVGPRL